MARPTTNNPDNNNRYPLTEEEPKPFLARHRSAAFAGLAMITILSGAVLLGTSSCSKEHNQTASTPSSATVAPLSATPTSPMVAVTQSQPEVAKKVKKVIRRKSATVTYTNLAYGVSFQYPRNYILKSGDEPHLDLAGLGPLQTDFVQPSGVTVVAVEMPRNAFPGADVSSAFFGVSVNPGLGPAECSQFASSHGASPEAEAGSQSQVKIGTLELHKAEEMSEHADTHYYHVFQNGVCYEFALGMGLQKDGPDNQTRGGDSEAVFAKLEKILSTVKLQAQVVPEVAVRAPAHSVEEDNR
jgi:hypothetical protein